MEDLLHIVGKIRRDSSKDGKITGRYDTTRITVGRPAKVGDRVERGLVKEASQKPRLTRHDATTTELRCADGDTQCWVSAKRGILRQGQDLLSSDQRNYFPPMSYGKLLKGFHATCYSSIKPRFVECPGYGCHVNSFSQQRRGSPNFFRVTVGFVVASHTSDILTQALIPFHSTAMLFPFLLMDLMAP